MHCVVVAARVLRPYVLDLTFADGTRQEVNIEPALYGELFEPHGASDELATPPDAATHG
jgi:hypothetical protein